MLGFGNLKDKIANLSEGLKSQFSTEIESTEVESNLKSQSEILSRYQVIISKIIIYLVKVRVVGVVSKDHSSSYCFSFSWKSARAKLRACQ